MPAAKPKSEHRKPLIVSCTEKQLDLINLKIEYLQKHDRALNKKIRDRSKIIMNILTEAIAKGNVFDKDMTYPREKQAKFQLSCSPAQYQSIIAYSEREIGMRSRSKWIVQEILNFNSIFSIDE